MPAPRDMNINRDFKGLVTNMAPHDRPPGAAQVQTNLQQIVKGRMCTRPGLRSIRWEN